ncbi:hypothetical protein [Methylomagnum ishizawai]|uniref:hypothetical protein n=1 Tax=Methylomagnum ishizawai TaxID=1760988 RepID=UPI000F74BA03|nr:hypothetical protein [Methylomagnum ishizawai]
MLDNQKGMLDILLEAISWKTENNTNVIITEEPLPPIDQINPLAIAIKGGKRDPLPKFKTK